jgi:hypothetical protein
MDPTPLEPRKLVHHGVAHTLEEEIFLVPKKLFIVRV